MKLCLSCFSITTFHSWAPLLDNHLQGSSLKARGLCASYSFTGGFCVCQFITEAPTSCLSIRRPSPFEFSSCSEWRPWLSQMLLAHWPMASRLETSWSSKTTSTFPDWSVWTRCVGQTMTSNYMDGYVLLRLFQRSFCVYCSLLLLWNLF